METICLASSAWLGHREKCMALFSRIADSGSAQGVTLLLDLPSVLRESGGTETAGERPIQEVQFRSWIKEGLNEDGVIDAELVRRALLRFPPEAIVVINASCFKSAVIASALGQARVALYPLTTWPRLIVLVTDDVQIFQLTPILASTFFLQPSIRRGGTVGRQLSSFTYYTRLLRVFGKNVGSIAHYFRRTVARWQTRRDNKMANRLGWTWEE